MLNSDILSPFAQKYLFNIREIPDQSDGILDIYVDATLNSQWDRTNNNLYQELLRDYKKLSEQDFQSFSEEADCINEEQGTWDIANPLDDILQDSEKRREVWHNKCSSKELASQEKCKNWRMEHLAHYCPAHTHEANKYGIHLTKRGICAAARRVHSLCTSEPIEVVLHAMIYKLFIHELSHAWIEDLCCVMDFSEGQKNKKSDRNYAIVNKRHNSYIFMEEAICNTAAYGLLVQYLLGPPYKRSPTMPAFNSYSVLSAFEQWMKKQPKGYRDFLPITVPPSASRIFIDNVGRLLVDIYGYGFANCYSANKGIDKVFDVVALYHSCDYSIIPFYDFTLPGRPPIHICK